MLKSMAEKKRDMELRQHQEVLDRVSNYDPEYIKTKEQMIDEIKVGRKDFTNCKFEYGLDLSSVDLSGFNFEGANISYVKLGNIKEANFQNANIKGTILYEIRVLRIAVISIIAMTISALFFVF